MAAPSALRWLETAVMVRGFRGMIEADGLFAHDHWQYDATCCAMFMTLVVRLGISPFGSSSRIITTCRRGQYSFAGGNRLGWQLSCGDAAAA